MISGRHMRKKWIADPCFLSKWCYNIVFEDGIDKVLSIKARFGGS